MRCKSFKEKIILHQYGELEDEERIALETHLEECPECAKDFAYTQKVFRALEDTRAEALPETDWEKSWQSIDTHILPKPRSTKRIFLFPRWAYAAAAVLIIFIAGIITGRFWLPSEAPSPAGTTVSQAYVEQSLQHYLEDLRPVLVEYANYNPEEKGQETIVMDKKVARSLLIQNLLLRNIVAKTDPSLLPFLDDVDIVLKEISNLETDDKQTPALIKDLIHDREILFKMEIIKTL